MANRLAQFIPPPSRGESTGVDFLGTRATNLLMMRNLLPGFSNMTSLVRVFSVMSWMAWRFGQARPDVADHEAHEQQKRFREKVEVLFAWSHVQDNDGNGLPGSLQTDKGESDPEWSFDTFKRQVSLADAAVYGAALRTLNGMGFLSGSLATSLATTDSGTRLAEALDASLRAHLTADQYDWLASVEKLSGPREMLKGLRLGWQVDSVTPAEQRAFADVLYRPQVMCEDTPPGRRTGTLFLLRHTLASAGASLTAEQTRQWLACKPLAPTLRDHPLHDMFAKRRLHWQVLQVRQAQRLGLECLFGWVERCMWHHDAASVDELVHYLTKALDAHGSAATFVRDTLEAYRASGTTLDERIAAPVGPFRATVLDDMLELEDLARDRKLQASLAQASLALLLRCVALTEVFPQDDETQLLADAGGSARVSLARWAFAVSKLEQRETAQFLRKVIETYILSQHLGVAALRSGQDASRMRFSIEDRGLTPLVPSAHAVLIPTRTADRLPTALALMAGCGLIQANASPRLVGKDTVYSCSSP